MSLTSGEVCQGIRCLQGIGRHLRCLLCSPGPFTIEQAVVGSSPSLFLIQEDLISLIDCVL